MLDFREGNYLRTQHRQAIFDHLPCFLVMSVIWSVSIVRPILGVLNRLLLWNPKKHLERSWIPNRQNAPKHRFSQSKNEMEWFFCIDSSNCLNGLLLYCLHGAFLCTLNVEYMFNLIGYIGLTCRSWELSIKHNHYHCMIYVPTFTTKNQLNICTTNIYHVPVPWMVWEIKASFTPNKTNQPTNLKTSKIPKFQHIKIHPAPAVPAAPLSNPLGSPRRMALYWCCLGFSPARWRG